MTVAKIMTLEFTSLKISWRLQPSYLISLQSIFNSRKLSEIHYSSDGIFWNMRHEMRSSCNFIAIYVRALSPKEGRRAWQWQIQGFFFWGLRKIITVLFILYSQDYLSFFSFKKLPHWEKTLPRQQQESWSNVKRTWKKILVGKKWRKEFGWKQLLPFLPSDPCNSLRLFYLWEVLAITGDPPNSN